MQARRPQTGSRSRGACLSPSSASRSRWLSQLAALTRTGPAPIREWAIRTPSGVVQNWISCSMQDSSSYSPAPTESWAATRARALSEVSRAFRTTGAPGTCDCPITLSVSRSVRPVLAFVLVEQPLRVRNRPASRIRRTGTPACGSWGCGDRPQRLPGGRSRPVTHSHRWRLQRHHKQFSMAWRMRADSSAGALRLRHRFASCLPLPTQHAGRDESKQNADRQGLEERKCDVDQRIPVHLLEP